MSHKPEANHEKTDENLHWFRTIQYVHHIIPKKTSTKNHTEKILVHEGDCKSHVPGVLSWPQRDQSSSHLARVVGRWKQGQFQLPDTKFQPWTAQGSSSQLCSMASPAWIVLSGYHPETKTVENTEGGWLKAPRLGCYRNS